MLRLVIAVLALLLPVPVLAQDQTTLEARAQDVAAVVRGDAAYGEVFAPDFVAAVPESQFAALLAQWRAQMGTFEGLEGIEPGAEPGSGTISLRYSGAVVSGPIRLENAPPWRVSGLLLNAIRPAQQGRSAVELVRDLPGDTAFLLARLDGSQVLAEHNAAQQMAVGSTFKLYVLSALVRQVASGQRRWDDVVPLTERSFPSGQMQDWPPGTPVTLQTLATMMIAISDNTATDQLMHVIGRGAVEEELIASGHADPRAALPMLSTRELFLLKLGPDGQLVRYATGTPEDRRAILATLEDRQLDMAQMQAVFANGPRNIGVEWFASAQDIAAIYRRLVADPVARGILGVNLGMDRTPFAAWQWAGYKGGSEPGVLNFSWVMQDQGGEFWTLVMTWNNPDAVVSEVQLLAIAQQALAEAARQ